MDYYISRKHYLLFQSNLSIYQKGLKVHVLFDKETMTVRLKMNIFQRILCLFNVFRRLLRVDIRSYVLAKNIFVFSFKNALYSINLIEKTYTVTYFKKSERPPLNIVYISGSKKCKDGFYFGQYPNNDQRHAVEILFSSNGKKWSCIYTFGEGTVNHIHSIVHLTSNHPFQILKHFCEY